MTLSRASSLLSLLLALSLLPLIAQSESLALVPAEACSVLGDSGLAARGEYRETSSGHYRCDSRRKTIVGGNNAQNEVRFSALGDAAEVRELRLELTVKSRGDTQRSHRKLAEYADSLTQNTLGSPLPEAVEAAILSGVSGQWTLDGRNVQLRRDTVADGLYALRLSIT